MGCGNFLLMLLSFFAKNKKCICDVVEDQETRDQRCPIHKRPCTCDEGIGNPFYAKQVDHTYNLKLECPRLSHLPYRKILEDKYHLVNEEKYLNTYDDELEKILPLLSLELKRVIYKQSTRVALSRVEIGFQKYYEHLFIRKPDIRHGKWHIYLEELESEVEGMMYKESIRYLFEESWAIEYPFIEDGEDRIISPYLDIPTRELFQPRQTITYEQLNHHKFVGIVQITSGLEQEDITKVCMPDEMCNMLTNLTIRKFGVDEWEAISYANPKYFYKNGNIAAYD